MPFNAGDTTFDFKGEFEENPGVYGVMNVVKKMIFVGQTKNLKKQIADHRADLYDWMHREGPTFVCFEEIADEDTRRKRASELTSEYNPSGNRL